jgi:hypothetical protein
MKEGKIIKGVFGKHTPIKPEKMKESPLRLGLSKNKVVDILDLKKVKSGFDVWSAVDIDTYIIEHCIITQGREIEEEVMLSEERHWKTLNPLRLIEAAANTNEGDWLEHPEKYMALARVIKNIQYNEPLRGA